MSTVHCLRILLAASCLAFAAPFAATSNAEGPEILWFNQTVRETSVLWQLQPTGHVFVRADLARVHDTVRIESTMQTAYRYPPAFYDRARKALVNAGLRDGAFMECEERARIGIRPQLALNLVSKDCKLVGTTVEAITNIVGPVAETAIAIIERWSTEMQQRASQCPLSDKTELSLRRKPDGDAGPVGVATCFFTKAFLDREQQTVGKSSAGIEYEASLSTDTLPVTTIVGDPPASIFVNGFAADFRTAEVPPIVPGTRSLQGQRLLPLVVWPATQPDGSEVIVDRPPDYLRYIGGTYSPTLTLWLLSSIWSGNLSITLKDGRGQPARVSVQNDRVTCSGFRVCTDLSVARARGLVAAAMGACRATLQERRREANRNRVDLTVAAGDETCRLRFRGYCLAHQDTGLNALVDNREPPHGLPEPRKPYALCGYANR